MNTVHNTNHQPRSGFGLLEVPDPPPLPKGSLIDHYVFESPAAAIALVLLAGLVIWVKFRHTDRSKRGTAAVVLGVATATALGVLASVVTTNAERLRETTARLVADAIQGQSDAVGGVLHEECVLTEPFSRDEMDRERILRGVRERLPTLGIAEHAILQARTHTPNDRFGKVQIKIRVNVKGAGIHFSWWELEYECDASGNWRVIRIKPLSMSGRDVL